MKCPRDTKYDKRVQKLNLDLYFVEWAREATIIIIIIKIFCNGKVGHRRSRKPHINMVIGYKTISYIIYIRQ